MAFPIPLDAPVTSIVRPASECEEAVISTASYISDLDDVARRMPPGALLKSGRDTSSTPDRSRRRADDDRHSCCAVGTLSDEERAQDAGWQGRSQSAAAPH